MFGALQGRGEAEEDTCNNRERDREGDHGGVYAHRREVFTNARETRSKAGKERANPDHADREPDRSAQQ